MKQNLVISERRQKNKNPEEKKGKKKKLSPVKVNCLTQFTMLNAIHKKLTFARMHTIPGTCPDVTRTSHLGPKNPFVQVHVP